MTAIDGDLTLDRAVTAFKNGEAGCDGVTYATGVNIHNSECCVRAGLAAALPHLTATIRAGVAEEIAQAISVAFEPTGPIDVTVAYNHAAHLAWQLRVPDCGDQYHGADGGPCSGCGFDVAEMPPSDAPQIAAAASEGAGGRSGPETAPQPVTGDDRRPGGPLPPPLVAAQPRDRHHTRHHTGGPTP